MPLEAWKNSVDDACQNDLCFIWDNDVRTEVEDYNRRLKETPGYVYVDWRIVLAMLWVETGPWSSEWKTRVMRFAVPGDLGYAALESHKGATTLVVRPDRLALIDEKMRTGGRAAFNDPVLNIQAGIAYLFTRMALSDDAPRPNPGDTGLHQHVVAAQETGSSIAQLEGTSVAELRASNPDVNIDRIHSGQVLRFHRMLKGRAILGWRVFDAKNVAAQYNGGGDPFYAEKVRYVYAKLTGDSGATAKGAQWNPSSKGHPSGGGGARAW